MQPFLVLASFLMLALFQLLAPVGRLFVRVLPPLVLVTLCVGLFPAIALAQDASVGGSSFISVVLGFLGNLVEYIPIALAFVGAFALLATKTPNTADDKIAQVLLDVINFLGANLGEAANKPPSPPS